LLDHQIDQCTSRRQFARGCEHWLAGLIRNQPIEAVYNNELNLALLGFEIQTELLPESGEDRIREAIGCR
jgi:hypothetical protein